jgi:hypothetical protein
MLRALTPNRAVVFVVCGFIAFWIAALFVPTPLLRDVFNSIGFGVALIVTITWGSAAWRAVREGANSGAWQLILSLYLGWMTVLMQRVYAIVFNWEGRPVEWLDWPISGFWPYSYAVAGLLLLSAPGVKADGMRSTALWSMIAAVAIGSLVAGILIGVNISTS